MSMRNGMAPVHPGVVLREELDELGLSANALAKAIDVPANRVTAILNAERGITADTALRLGRYFDTSAQFWLNLQQTWQIRMAERKSGPRIIECVVPQRAEALAKATRQAKATSNQAASMLRAIERDVALCEQLSTFERAVSVSALNQRRLRALVGPCRELGRVGAFQTALGRELRHTTQWFAKYEQRFRRATAADVSKLTPRVGSSIERLAAMKSPWLDAQNRLGSVERILGLRKLGDIVGGPATYAEPATVQIRTFLGDWRERIAWPDHIWRDLGARADFYADLGFDADLTDLPVPAFREAAEAADLRSERPSLIESYGPPVPSSQAASDEAAFARTNNAHDWLQRFESHLRRFIDIVMTRAFGLKWPKHRLPNGMYERWKEKQQTAARAGRAEWPIVAYADFNDYVAIITRQDNWQELFQSYFERPEAVRESFQRLYPIRLDTMHARFVSQDDELLLYVEVKRIMCAIKDLVRSGDGPPPHPGP